MAYILYENKSLVKKWGIGKNFYIFGLISIKSRIFCLNSTCVKVHPDAAEALKKSGKQAIGKTKGGFNPKIHMISPRERTPIAESSYKKIDKIIF